MIKLLIVDDEPLVQVGIKSMLDWSSLDITICGTAFNGEQALNIIHEHQPDIVLTDIKMPIMSGLELLKRCRALDEDLPVFILLTSYDDFSLAKEALQYQALDYLIKLDITPEILTDTIEKAIKKVNLYKRRESTTSITSTQPFYDRFMVRLLNNIFDDKNQFDLQARELKLDFNALAYTTCLCTFSDFSNEDMSQEKLLNLYFSAVQMVDNLVKKHMSCYLITLDPKNFCIIFKHDTLDNTLQRDAIRQSLTTSFEMVYNYFTIRIHASVGRGCVLPLSISESYQDARQIQSLCTKEKRIIFYHDYINDTSILTHNTFNLGIFKNDIQLAFESYDPKALETTLNTLIDLFKNQPSLYLQAMDATSNILYLTLSLLPNSSQSLDAIFKDTIDGYRSLYKYTQIDQVMTWLNRFKEGICAMLQSQHKTYKNHMIKSIQDYVDLHINAKLSLNDIASIFGISPNYLSILFKKTTDIGFNEYITLKKIALAKVMLLDQDVKIYEVADKLGFESAFYFSKVFKKVEGCPPREFIQNHYGDT